MATGRSTTVKTHNITMIYDTSLYTLMQNRSTTPIHLCKVLSCVSLHYLIAPSSVFSSPLVSILASFLSRELVNYSKQALSHSCTLPSFSPSPFCSSLYHSQSPQPQAQQTEPQLKPELRQP